MILTADSAEARAANRRKTGNGWHTTFIGKNRNTLQPGEAPPEPGALYPMAFLVEKESGAVVRPHFHQADQFQVVVQGGGRLGRHDIGTVAVHYTDAWSAYGPIVAAEEGVSWFTLRNTWDPGAKYMPGARPELRAARARHQHRESTSPPMAAWSTAELGRLGSVDYVTEMATPDGMASWRFRLPGDSAATGPDPGNGSGQFWLVLAGNACCDGSSLLPEDSCVFVGPEDRALAVSAGPEGAELLCVQFPQR
ncbi:MAG TPA: hypothetical protein VMB73_09645 [Acetobacteraceae bacterium]|jgi:hypothetical protein|nr:hypothetical protein [Acetobacteraceae bacterium]